MTGPEFAANHGNDSSTWTTTDFETEINLAEIDAHTARQLGKTPADIQYVRDITARLPLDQIKTQQQRLANNTPAA